MNKNLAIYGGPKTIDKNFDWPVYNETDVDVVARVDRRERRRDGDAAAGEHFALRGMFATGANAFLRAGDDDFKITTAQRIGLEQTLARDD